MRYMRFIRRLIRRGAINAVRLAAMPFIASYRAIGRTVGHGGSFIGSKYRSLAFNMATTTMTLSLDDGQAQLLVLKGNKVIAWRSGEIAQRPDEPAADLVKGTGPKESIEQPVFNPLGSLLGDLPARTNRVVTDLPLYAPLLRHVPLPDVKGRDLKKIVEAEVLDSVPFEADEVYVRWRIEQREDIKEASVIAVPRERMDGQVDVVRESQLAPSAVYPKAAALAAAVARPDVFILHMTQGETAVVLVRGGVARIVHRLELPQNPTQQVAMGVGQVAGYHRSQRPDDDVSELPVVITGEVNQVQNLIDLLSSILDRPILPFESSLGCPEGFDPSEYAANIGLFLIARSKESARVTAAQNVLPERFSPKTLPVAATTAFSGLLALGFLAFTFTGMVSEVVGELDPLNAKLETMERQAREYRLTVARQRVFDERIAESDLEVLELEANLLLLEHQMDTLQSRIGDITNNAGPSSVDLTQVVPLPDGFSVSGSAETPSDVLGYAAAMRTSENFEDAMVVQIADLGESHVAFTVVLTFPRDLPQEDQESGAQAQSP